MCRTLRYVLRNQASVPPACWLQETDKQCRFEKIADVLNRITWGQIAGLDDIADMDDGGSYSEDGHGNDGCLTEAIAAAHSDNAENADRQIGKADLKLKRIPGRPADGFGHRVEKKKWPKKPPIRLPTTPIPKRYSKKISSCRSRLRVLLSSQRWPTATMRGNTE
jgi:hypothetical protein